MKTIDIAYVNEILQYDADSGELRWKERSPNMFKSIRDCKAWNTRYANSIAGHIHMNRSRNYQCVHVNIGGKIYKGHRIVWAMMTGEQPPEQIDHIDGNATNNRWDNMRSGIGVNFKNRGIRSNNTSGITGVHWNKEKNKWKAQVTLDKKVIHVGYFVDVYDAERAVLAKRKELGFSDRHGKAS